MLVMNCAVGGSRKESPRQESNRQTRRIALACCRRGAGAVEFALCVPILLLVVGGIAELGRFIFTGDALANAVREGARAAIVRGSASSSPLSASGIQELVKSRAASLATQSISVTVTYSPNNDPGSVVTIQARYPLSFVMPPFSALGAITLSRSASLIIAN